MEPATVIGILLTALVTLLLAQVTGMRADLKEMISDQREMNDRLTRLETEHQTRTCKFERVM
jgi:hypothetical protein